ncbi:MAG: hypothetical protein WBQ11_24370, partial [Isosphaeraceae bacterium]
MRLISHEPPENRSRRRVCTVIPALVIPARLTRFPYLGPDSWIYWCKGTFARQTHERPGKTPLATRAALIVLDQINGGGLNPVQATALLTASDPHRFHPRTD